ncbi:MAG: antitoxin [Nocardia sp.]|nr:antitoxin [Nocardia sp.]
MGMFDFKDVAGKAAELAVQNADKLDPLVEKVGDMVDAQTDGKFAKQVDAAQEAAKKALRDQAGK